jgi:MYXO-CTERM domain-containing protein
MWIDGGHGSSSADTAGSLIDGTAFLVLILLGIGTLLRRRVDWQTIFRANLWVLVFYLYCGFSVLWSDYSLVSLKRWIKDVGHIVMILVILSEANPVQALREVFTRCAYVLVPLSVLFMKYYPQTGTYYNDWTGECSFCGATDGKNQLGRLGLTMALFMVWILTDLQNTKTRFGRIRQGLPEMAVLLLCLWVLRKANSATSLACFVIATAVFYGLRLRWIKDNSKFVALCGWAFVLISIIVFKVP